MSITNKDVEKLKETFVTKEDFSKLRNDMLTGFDKVYKKLEDISIEQKMSFAQYKRPDEKVEDHEKRIKTLEVNVLAA